MLTSKAISTISWNSDLFLYKVLKRLYEQDLITFYSMVYHYKEDDELKDHWHIFMIPNGRIDTSKLREEFIEIVNNNDKPLCCLPFDNSKWQDWFLYNSHDVKYLASKGLSRKYHYRPEDFVSSDEMAFTEKLHTMDLSKLNGQERFAQAVADGFTFEDLLCRGFVPFQLVHQYERVYQTLKFGKFGGSKGGSSTTP